jgi:hypothetical protein
MDDPPPITVDPHVLRPHHLSIVALIIILLKPPGSSGKSWSSTASLHVLRLIIEEVSQVSKDALCGANLTLFTMDAACDPENIL